MSIADTSNTHVHVGLTVRYVRPVDGCVASTEHFGSKPDALREAQTRAVELMATDPNVYEVAVTYSLTDRDREAEAFPQCYGDDDEVAA